MFYWQRAGTILKRLGKKKQRRRGRKNFLNCIFYICIIRFGILDKYTAFLFGVTDNWHNELRPCQRNSRPWCHSLSTMPEEYMNLLEMFSWQSWPIWMFSVCFWFRSHHLALHQLFDGADQFSSTGRFGTARTSGETRWGLKKRREVERKHFTVIR